jgi:hypothetical protein
MTQLTQLWRNDDAIGAIKQVIIGLHSLVRTFKNKLFDPNSFLNASNSMLLKSEGSYRSPVFMGSSMLTRDSLRQALGTKPPGSASLRNTFYKTILHYGLKPMKTIILRFDPPHYA